MKILEEPGLKNVRIIYSIFRFTFTGRIGGYTSLCYIDL